MPTVSNTPAKPTTPLGSTPATSSQDADFTLDDFRKQFAQLKNMGPMREVMASMPGVRDMIPEGEDQETAFGRIQGMIDSMTKAERRNPDVIDINRRRRIAAGSGAGPHDIKQFLGQFEQEPLIVDLHAYHSEHTIRMRFFSLVKTHSRDSLIRLCHLDYDREIALAAVQRDEGGAAHMLGVSRYYLDPETGEAEFAVVVGDAHQHQGLGRHLMKRLITAARDRGVRRLAGLILRENAPMLALMASLGFSEPEAVEDNVVRVALDLAKGLPA